MAAKTNNYPRHSHFQTSSSHRNLYRQNHFSPYLSHRFTKSNHGNEKIAKTANSVLSLDSASAINENGYITDSFLNNFISDLVKIRDVKRFERDWRFLVVNYSNDFDITQISNMILKTALFFKNKRFLQEKAAFVYNNQNEIMHLIMVFHRNFSAAGARDLSNTMWAFSKIKFLEYRLFERIAEQTIINIKDFNSRELADIAKAFAEIDCERTDLFKAIINESILKIKSLNPKDLVKIARAIAKSGIKHDEFFEKIAEESILKIDEFRSEDLAKMGMIFASLRIRNEKLFDAIAAKSISIINKLSCNNLADIALAFKSFGYINSDLFEAIAKESILKINDFNPTSLTNLACSFCSFKVPNHQLFEKIAFQSVNKIEGFTSSELVDLVRSFDKINFVNTHLLEKFPNAFIVKINELSSHELVNFARFFSRINFVNTHLFKMMADEFIDKIKELSCNELIDVLHFFIKNKIKNSKLFDKISTELILKIKKDDFQELPRLASDFAVIRSRKIEFIETLITKSLEKSDLSVKNIFYILQAYLYLKLLCSVSMDARVEEKIKALLKKLKESLPPRSSNLYLEVAQTLRNFFPNNEIHTDFLIACYPQDIVLDQKKKIAVKVDVCPYDPYNLQEQFKHDILSKLGWSIYHIDYHKDWVKQKFQILNHLKDKFS